MARIYVAKGDRLESESGRPPIRLTPDFFLASHDPMLSFRRSGICYPPGPNYTFFQAVRTAHPITVVDVVGSTYEPAEENFYGRMLSCDAVPYEGIFRLPAGSLMLREFDQAVGMPKGKWFVLRPDHECLQNLQRVHLPFNRQADLGGVSSTHDHEIMKTTVQHYWPDDAQSRAQLDDIALLIRLENQQTFTGRIVNYLQALKPEAWA